MDARLSECLKRDDKPRHGYYERASHGKPASELSRRIEPLKKAPCVHHEKPDPRQHTGEPDAERDNEEQPKPDASKRNRAKQDDDRRGTRKHSTRHSEGEQTLPGNRRPVGPGR